MISDDEYELLNEFQPLLVNYFQSLDNFQTVNRWMTVLVGFTGSWWLWYFGIINFVEDTDFELIIQAIVSIIFINFISNSTKEYGTMKRTWILRILVIVGIYQLQLRNVNILLSLFLFSIGIVYQDLLSPIIKRVRRTQRYLGLTPNDLQMYGLIKSNYDYLNDRYKWINFSTILIFGISLIGIVLLQTIIIITSFNPSLFQYLAFASILGLLIILLPKLFPPVEIKDRYSLSKE